MLKNRIILLVSAIVLVAIIFSLPRVVVDNDPKKMDESEAGRNHDEVPDAHLETLDPSGVEKANTLKENLRGAENVEKSIIFADSLAKLYLSVNKYDSAAKFIEIIAEKVPSETNWFRAGSAYYDAYGFAMDDAKQEELGKKARFYFEKVLEQSPKNLDAKNKLAMTYLTTSNPMQGIMMLREILESDPNNEQAMFNLGMLSMQSGQYDKAVERFKKLTELYPNNTQAQFFLGVSYKETGNKEKAKEQFELVKTLDSDPSVQATADSYLKEIE
ncbi:MAG TPA: tetratricopeptide repeat protein [Fulvivirga sp.]|nr:tetratricopeptide repeat protein [Fulvivirga sp.]